MQKENQRPNPKLQIEAIGKEIFGPIQVVDKIAASHMKLIPDVLITGGGGQGNTNNLENMPGLMLNKKMTGKKFEVKETNES